MFGGRLVSLFLSVFTLSLKYFADNTDVNSDHARGSPHLLTSTMSLYSNRPQALANHNAHSFSVIV